MQIIVSAAVRYRGQVYVGDSHNFIYAEMLNCLGFVKLSECEYGFITNLDEFVDRVAAAKIAFEAGQIPYDTGYLISEDLIKTEGKQCSS